MNMTSLAGVCYFLALDKLVRPEFMRQTPQPNLRMLLVQSFCPSVCLVLSLCLCACLSVSPFHSWSLFGNAVKGVGVGNIQLSHPGSHVTLGLVVWYNMWVPLRE